MTVLLKGKMICHWLHFHIQPEVERECIQLNSRYFYVLDFFSFPRKKKLRMKTSSEAETELKYS